MAVPDLDTGDLVLLMLAGGGAKGTFRGITRLEKLLFLLSEEGGLSPQIAKPRFDAYKYGPFSKEIYDAVEFLRSIELVAAEEHAIDPEDSVELQELDPDVASYEPRSFRLTDRGQRVASRLAESIDPKTIDSINALLGRYGRMPLSQLIRYVYARYPDYTSKSLIRPRVVGR